MNDQLRDSDLPPAPSTAPPAIALSDLADTLTRAESAHQPTPLALQAQTLADEVVTLRDAANALSTRTTRHGWVLVLTVVGLTIDVGLGIFAFLLLHTQSASNTRLESQQRQIQQQQVQLDTQQRQATMERRNGLCKLYTLFFDDQAQARLADLKGSAHSDAVFAELHAQAAALRCDSP